MNLKKVDCTCHKAYTTRKLQDPNCCACSCSYNDAVERIAELEKELSQFAPNPSQYYKNQAKRDLEQRLAEARLCHDSLESLSNARKMQVALVKRVCQLRQQLKELDDE